MSPRTTQAAGINTEIARNRTIQNIKGKGRNVVSLAE